MYILVYIMYILCIYEYIYNIYILYKLCIFILSIIYIYIMSILKNISYKFV